MTRAATRGAAALLLALAALRAPAEELAVFTGVTDTDDHTSVSYSWELEYRRALRRYLDFSITYLNEGHVRGHHRDGATAQIWAVSPLWHERLSLALGFGPYFYFDTQDVGSGAGFRDYHGVGAIATASLSYYFAPSWFMRLNLSEVHTPGDEDTRTLVLGVGHTLDTLFEHFGGFALEAPAGSEVGLFFGQTIDNTANSPRSRAFGLEYRRTLTRDLELSAGWLNESDGHAGSHNGLIGQAWLVDPLFGHRATLSLGAGPYVALERRETADGELAARVEGMVPLSVSWRFAPHVLARFTWDRGFTNVSQDRDVVLLGVGWRFGN
ncbi:MAG TPA: hypothetical protein VL994_08715 [Steroidobacteraceae bacterium]|nr:hypothetical protein [Steroidobacteraceae bacterium]